MALEQGVLQVLMILKNFLTLMSLFFWCPLIFPKLSGQSVKNINSPKRELQAVSLSDPHPSDILCASNCRYLQTHAQNHTSVKADIL